MTKATAQHTPGPWSVRKTPWAEGKKYYIDGPRGRCLATTLSMESSDPTKKAEVAANARLIAAAPELLEALEECSKRLRSAAISGGTDEEYADIAIEKYTALIAKATGAA